MTIEVIDTEKLNELIKQANMDLHPNLVVMSVILTNTEIQSASPEVWDTVMDTINKLQDMTFTCTSSNRSGEMGKAFTFTGDKRQVVQTLQYVKSVICDRKHKNVNEFQSTLNVEDVSHGDPVGPQATCPLFK